VTDPRANRLEVWAPDGMPEVAAGDDLAGLVLAALSGDGGAGTQLRDGDVVCVTSKVVSKAEGRTRRGAREDAIDEETVRVLARRGPTRIVRTRLGLTMAAAGVDASNVEPGSVVLLPLDPDASARALRRETHARTGVNVGVVVTDTAGRAWREGQTDIAVGAAGLLVAEDFAGRTDPHGNPLAVTLPAVADEIAGAAELAQGKLSGRPVAVVRGRGDLVLPVGQDGPGAASLVRPDGVDLFGWGAREAVVRALAGADADRTPFGAPADLRELHSALTRVVDTGQPLSSTLSLTFDDRPDGAVVVLPATAARGAVAAVCFAHGWRLDGWDPAGTDVVCAVSPVTT
jgi:coenzyme F420-0:L-glutamate ligase/coenzyme F420-1:gamma-L-glutamate ligase